MKRLLSLRLLPQVFAVEQEGHRTDDDQHDGVHDPVAIIHPLKRIDPLIDEGGEGQHSQEVGTQRTKAHEGPGGEMPENTVDDRHDSSPSFQLAVLDAPRTIYYYTLFTRICQE
jgi:hypothetical protein